MTDSLQCIVTMRVHTRVGLAIFCILALPQSHSGLPLRRCKSWLVSFCSDFACGNTSYADLSVFVPLISIRSHWWCAGNKSDLVAEREVATSVGEEFARRHGMRFLETSAKAADNVDALFSDIAHQLVSDAIRDGMTHTMRSADTTSLGSSSPVLVLPNCCHFS